MAKTSSVEKNNTRRKKTAKFANRRTALKTIIMDKSKTPEDRFEATIKLAAMPRNGARVRIRNRCALTGRPRAYYRKFDMSRIALREQAAFGMLPGVTKASW
jgi:small subunit ribosomal protein S14